jgi:periplasmic protein TonB
MSRLLFGLGCCWATNTIARERRALELSASGAATGSKSMTVSAHPDLTFLSRRTTALVIIIALHGAVIYAFATGLGQRLIEPLQAPLKVDFLREPATRALPPPLPKLNLTPLRTVDPGPIPHISVTEPGPDTIQTQLQPAVTEPARPPSSPVPAKRVTGGPGKGFPNSDDYYPPAARRLGEQGSTAVQVCVDVNGRLTAEPQVVQSSGSARLDEGAIKLATAGSGHYRPTTEDGAPVSSCYGYRIRFNLR